MPGFRVLIAGAGLGGLALAQLLRRNNIEVALFERDASPWERPQGYRLHLEADALNALREVLPADLHALFEATAQRTTPYTTILRQDLSVVKRLPTDDGKDLNYWPTADTTIVHCNVDRATLRQILLTDLDEVCRYGKRLTHYDASDEGVTAFFEDGTSLAGDILVGADGMRSAVRAQRAPNARIMDAGVQAIYGRIPLDVAQRNGPAEVSSDIFAIASDERKVFFAMGAVDFPALPQDATPLIAPRVAIKPQQRYAVCIVGGRHDYWPHAGEHQPSTSSEDLQAMAADMLAAWPPNAAKLVRSSDASSFFHVQMSSSVPFELDPPMNVTLLGDAIHGMTPTLGRGANLAMRDGALLGRALAAVAAGATPIKDALRAYEAEMQHYGFRVVRESVELGMQRMGQRPLPP